MIAAPARRRASQSARSATTAARLVRIVAVARPRLARSCSSASAARAASGNGGVPREGRLGAGSPRGSAVRPSGHASRPGRGQDLGEVHHPDRRPRRDSSPPMCMRHEVSPAVRTSAPDPRTSSTLSRPIATEVSAFLTANVPPNPQHASERGRSTSVRPSTAASSRVGRSPTPSRRVEWHVGWNATVCGNRAPTSVTPSDVDEELAQLEDARRDRRDALRQAVVVALLGRQLRHQRVIATDHRGARARRRDDAS